MRISDWSSDVCSSDLLNLVLDLAAIVVRIKQQRDRDQRGDDEQHKAADDEKNDFQRLGHERTLTGSIGDIVVQGRKSGRSRHAEASTDANILHARSEERSAGKE